MMVGVSITYAPRSDITPEAELSALAACYRFLLDCGRTTEHARPTDPDDIHSIRDPEGVSNVDRRPHLGSRIVISD
jgi:hypothetical protein